MKKQDQKANIPIEEVEKTFLEMTVIVESISGIFNLLKLGKVNSQKGNCELSLLYFAQAAHVFALVKNRS